MTDATEKAQLLEAFASRGDTVIPLRDYRFAASANQFNMCWTVFNELLVCRKKFGASDTKCLSKHKNMLSQCPFELITQWEEQTQDPKKWLGVSENGPAKLDHTPFGNESDAKLVAQRKAK